MRKFGGRVAIVVAACLLLGEGKAQAKFGVPDDVPASTLLFPFFKVDPNPGPLSRQDTLIVVTNTSNPQVALPQWEAVRAHVGAYHDLECDVEAYL